MANLEKKLSKAYEKIGKKIGYDFDVYNPQAYTEEPLNSLNWFTKTKISLTQSDYSDSKGEGFEYYECYTGFSDVKSGSLLVDKTNDRTFVVINHEVNHGINAMECFNTITVSRPTNTYDGNAITNINTLVNLPSSVMIGGADTGASLISQSRSATTFTHSAVIRFQTIFEVDVKIGDKVVDNDSNIYEIMAVQRTSTGYKVVANGIRP